MIFSACPTQRVRELAKCHAQDSTVYDLQCIRMLRLRKEAGETMEDDDDDI